MDAADGQPTARQSSAAVLVGRAGPLALTTFQDVQLEAHYQRERSTYLAKHYDWPALMVHFIMNVGGAFAMLTRNKGCGPLMTYVFACMFLQAAILWLMHHRTYINHRTSLIIVIRLLFLLATVVGQPSCSQGRARKQKATDVADLMWHNGVAGLWYYTGALQLGLLPHTVVHLFSTLIYVWRFNPSLCARLAPRSPWWVTAWWAQADSASQDFLLAHGFPRIRSAALETFASKCLSLTSYIQLVGGFLLPTAIVYIREQAHRATFLKQRGMREKQRAASFRCSSALVSEGYILCIICSVLWEVTFSATSWLHN